MPTVQETLDEFLIRLDEYAVIVDGTRADTNISLERSAQAISDIEFARVDVRGYTDIRIQQVMDYIVDLIEQWGINFRGGIVDDITDGTGVIIDGIVQDWDAWQAIIDANIAQILADYAILNQWAEDTWNIEIPRILAEVAVYVEETRQLEQDMLNEMGRSRQETAEMAARWRELADEAYEARAKILEMDYSIYDIKDEMQRRLSVELDGRLSSFDERITVAVGDAGAVADRVQTLEVAVGDQQAQVQTLERALIDGDEQLAQQITSLSVGTNTQFDPFQIWHFDTTAEGWTGTWSNGYLRTGDSTQSPILNINASQYRQVRMRIKRVGTPTWDGYLNWTGATPSGPENIPEPDWTNNLGEITINPAWSGTLTRMTLNLSSGSDGSNYYELDWITVGRPAPGASSADIITERTARITADSALAVRLDALELDYVTLDGNVTAHSTAIDGILSEITDINGNISNINSAMTLFTTQITDITTGNTVNANAISTLTNRVDLTDGNLTALNSRVDQFEIDLNGLVTSDVYNGLVQRVEETETGIATITSQITSFTTTVATVEGNLSTAQALAQNAANLAGTKGKVFVQDDEPPVAERVVQNLWIDTTAGANTPKRWDGSGWEAVSDKIARDAAQAAADALAGLGNKADAAALTALSQQVTDIGGILTSTSSQMTSLSNTLTTVSGTASDAQTAAQNAATLAGSKGKVIVQSSTPPSAERLPQNLWIDTSNNNNTPKRWNGSSWVSVTDKVALDAAAAAAAANNALASKADASALTALTSRVAATETGISSVSSNITVLTNSIDTTATATANAQAAAEDAATLAGSKGRVFFQGWAPGSAHRVSQNLWIDTTDNNNTPKRWDGTAWVAVTDKIATDAKAAADAATIALGSKADASYVDTVNQTVTQMGTALTSVTSRVTTTENRINNATTGLNALSTSINSVNNRVTQTNGVVSAQADSISGISSRVNASSANAMMRAYTAATPAGALSRIAIVARASNDILDNVQSPGLFIEAGTNNINTVTIMANRFAIIQDQAGGGKFVPFYVKDGITYIKSAMIENASIVRAHIGTLAVDTLRIADGAITVLRVLKPTAINESRALFNDPITRTLGSLSVTPYSANSVLVLTFYGEVDNGRIDLFVNNVRMIKVTPDLEVTGTGTDRNGQTFAVVSPERNYFSRVILLEGAGVKNIQVRCTVGGMGNTLAKAQNMVVMVEEAKK